MAPAKAGRLKALTKGLFPPAHPQAACLPACLQWGHGEGSFRKHRFQLALPCF